MIEDIVLSPILIFLMFLAVLLVITQWASRKREMPGYLLGWMIGVFLIIIYQSLTGRTQAPEPEIAEEVAQNAGHLTANAILLPSALGLVAGLVASAVYAFIVRTHARRSVAVAIITATLVWTLFMIATASDSWARVFGVFALAFGIGVLGTFVITGGQSPMTRTANVNRSRQRYDDEDDLPDPRFDDIPAPTADRSAFGLRKGRSQQPAPPVQRPPIQGMPVQAPPQRPPVQRPPAPVDEPIDGAQVERANLDNVRDRFDQIRRKFDDE